MPRCAMSWMSFSPHTRRLACVRDMVRPVVLRHVGRPRPERAGGAFAVNDRLQLASVDHVALELGRISADVVDDLRAERARVASEHRGKDVPDPVRDHLPIGERGVGRRDHRTEVGLPLLRYGKERPLCTEHTESCWAQNRRAHFLAKPR